VSYRITVARSAEKELQRIPDTWADKIMAAIDRLTSAPRPPGSKKLKGSKDLWRLRVADYRIIYAIDDVIRLIAIEKIAHRKEAYD
jgi:mRNA interferase RelE/StbE